MDEAPTTTKPSLPSSSRTPWGDSDWRWMAVVAFGLYIAAQALPAFQRRPNDGGISSGPGILVTYLSFVGLVYDGSPMGRMQGLHGNALFTLKLTCLMGAAANVLIVVGVVSVWIRKDRFGFLAASTAAALAVLVLFPLGVWREPWMIGAGYLCWAGSAGLLAYASWRLSSPQKFQKLCREL